ncbi:hypothetical protein CR105_00220 [Massilia eurypsychrophila]|uniref:Uncharacterized protein n=2 Tax=Massilia eurypsychrophila TaxID=1485217 RepID=A0A2G8TKU4_9BURK|nr:hypothetical protein CR105_00220 [Massilia eurypsychrophila]
MKDLLGEFIERQEAMANEIENRFKEYFRAAVVPPVGASGPAPGGNGVVAIEIASPGCSADDVLARIRLLPRGPGLYVIMTTCDIPGRDVCTFAVRDSDVKAIYRGHSSNVGDRIMSHLTNTAYMAMCDAIPSKKPWGGFIKIAEGVGDGGIDITSVPYTTGKWTVVVFPMEGSSEPLRRLAEEGFSLAFGTPVRSIKEPKNRRGKRSKIPSASPTGM